VNISFEIYNDGQNLEGIENYLKSVIAYRSESDIIYITLKIDAIEYNKDGEEQFPMDSFKNLEVYIKEIEIDGVLWSDFEIEIISGRIYKDLYIIKGRN